MLKVERGEGDLSGAVIEVKAEAAEDDATKEEPANILDGVSESEMQKYQLSLSFVQKAEKELPEEKFQEFFIVLRNRFIAPVKTASILAHILTDYPELSKLFSEICSDESVEGEL